MPKKELPGIKVKVEVEVEVPRDWLDWAGGGEGWADLYQRCHCGYFLARIEQSEDLRSALAWEDEEDSSNPGADAEEDEMAPHADAIAAFHAGNPLPKNYHLINEDFMVRAFVEGVKKFGADWYDPSQTDANTYDTVIQMALFGEQKYA